MRRLIDADILFDAMEKTEWYDNADRDEIAERLIMDAPTIDIVRCRECRHRNERCGMGEHRWCEILNMSTTPDDFCSYGERKSE